MFIFPFPWLQLVRILSFFWVSRVLIAVNTSELIEYHPRLCKWQAVIFQLIKKWFLLFIHKNQGKHELKTVSQNSVNSTYLRSGWYSRLEVAPSWGCLLYLPVLCLSYAKLSLFEKKKKKAFFFLYIVFKADTVNANLYHVYSFCFWVFYRCLLYFPPPSPGWLLWSH